ncbi:MAG: hypothetical protein WCI12_00100 [Actinomycetes bacterium]
MTEPASGPEPDGLFNEPVWPTAKAAPIMVNPQSQVVNGVVPRHSGLDTLVDDQHRDRDIARL